MKNESKKKPKIMFHAASPKPGQSLEDFKKEMAEKHGIDDTKVVDGSDMSQEDIKAMLANMGMDPEEIDNMLAGGEQKKKTGIFQKIQDALFD